MTNEPKELKEIHKIREIIYEETKNMTPGERAKYANKDAQEMIKEYKLKIRYENGYGDYTKEKYQHPDLTVKEIGTILKPNREIVIAPNEAV